MKIIKREKEMSIGRLYGNKMSAHNRLGAHTFNEGAGIKLHNGKLISVRIIRMENSYPVDVIETVRERNGVALREYTELSTVRNEEELKRDERIFKTLEAVLKKRDVRTIKLSSFIKEIIARLKSDTRFAYKNFEKEKSQNAEHCVYIYTLLAIIVATVSAVNDIDFSSSVLLSTDKYSDAMEICFKSTTRELKLYKNRDSILKIPRLEAKIAYLNSLCAQDGVSSEIKATGNTIIFKYRIKNAPPEAMKLYSKYSEETEIFSELLYAFNPPSTYEPDDSMLEEEI